MMTAQRFEEFWSCPASKFVIAEAQDGIAPVAAFPAHDRCHDRGGGVGLAEFTDHIESLVGIARKVHARDMHRGSESDRHRRREDRQVARSRGDDAALLLVGDCLVERRQDR